MKITENPIYPTNPLPDMNAPTLPRRGHRYLTIGTLIFGVLIFLGGIVLVIVAMKRDTVPVPPTGIESYR